MGKRTLSESVVLLSSTHLRRARISDIAKASTISTGTLTAIMRGHRQPSLQTVEQLAVTFGISETEVLTIIRERQESTRRTTEVTNEIRQWLRQKVKEKKPPK